MSTTVTFLGEGAGDMAIVECGDGSTILVDCGVTAKNRSNVMRTIFSQIDASEIDVFVALNVTESRRRGLQVVNERLSIRKIWDGGIAGDAAFDGLDGYRSLRTNFGVDEIDQPRNFQFGSTKISVVRAVPESEARTAGGPLILRLADVEPDSMKEHGSVLFASDASMAFWAEALAVLPPHTLQSDVLAAGHHGGESFFDTKSKPDAATVADVLDVVAPNILLIGETEGGLSYRETIKQVFAAYADKRPAAELTPLSQAGAATMEIRPDRCVFETDAGRTVLNRDAA